MLSWGWSVHRARWTSGSGSSGGVDCAPMGWEYNTRKVFPREMRVEVMLCDRGASGCGEPPEPFAAAGLSFRVGIVVVSGC
jgi:hypothetical protein